MNNQNQTDAPKMTAKQENARLKEIFGEVQSVHDERSACDAKLQAFASDIYEICGNDEVWPNGAGKGKTGYKATKRTVEGDELFYLTVIKPSKKGKRLL